jgi:transposase
MWLPVVDRINTPLQPPAVGARESGHLRAIGTMSDLGAACVKTPWSDRLWPAIRGAGMKRFAEGENRQQTILLPDCLDDYVIEDNPVRVIDVFIDELDLAALGIEGMPAGDNGTPRLSSRDAAGCLNRIPSSRRLERETQRNIELMWLTGRLMPDFKTIADFRKDNGAAIRAVCQQFMVLCRRLFRGKKTQARLMHKPGP